MISPAGLGVGFVLFVVDERGTTGLAGGMK